MGIRRYTLIPELSCQFGLERMIFRNIALLRDGRTFRACSVFESSSCSLKTQDEYVELSPIALIEPWVYCVIDWPIDGQTDWWTDWLMDVLTDWLINWLNDWSVDRLIVQALCPVEFWFWGCASYAVRTSTNHSAHTSRSRSYNETSHCRIRKAAVQPTWPSRANTQ